MEKNDKKLGNEVFKFLFDRRRQSRCSVKEAVYLMTNGSKVKLRPETIL